MEKHTLIIDWAVDNAIRQLCHDQWSSNTDYNNNYSRSFDTFSNMKVCHELMKEYTQRYMGYCRHELKKEGAPFEYIATGLKGRTQFIEVLSNEKNIGSYLSFKANTSNSFIKYDELNMVKASGHIFNE